MCQSCTSFFVIASAVFYGMAIINSRPTFAVTEPDCREFLVQKPELGVRIEASYDKQNLSTSEDISQNSIAAGNLE